MTKRQQLEDQFQSEGRTELGQDLDEFEAPEISEQEYAEHAAGIVAKALEDTNLIEIVEMQPTASQINLLGRVKQENEKKLVHSVVFSILKRCNGFSEPHIGKIFFLKNDKLVYGWIFSFSTTDMKTTVQSICQAIEEVAPKKEVLEAPLVGPNPPTGSIGGRKGASPIK